MDAQSGAGRFEARCQGEPNVVSPGFRQPQGVQAWRQGSSVAWRPAAIEGLAGGESAHGLPAGQESFVLMKLQCPKAFSIKAIALRALSRQRQGRCAQTGKELWVWAELPRRLRFLRLGV